MPEVDAFLADTSPDRLAMSSRFPSRRASLQSHLGYGALAAAYLLHADGVLALASPGGMDMRPRTGCFPSRDVRDLPHAVWRP